MEPMLGMVFIFPGTFAPRGYAYCNGQLLTIQQNAALYSLLGVQFGGNGSVNFGVPNLVGRAPVGAGTVNNVTWQQAQTGGGTATFSGTGQATITANNLPQHSHGATFAGTGGGTGTSVNVTVGIGTGTGTTPTVNAGDNVYLSGLAGSVKSGLTTLNATFQGPYTTTAPTATANLAGISTSGGGGGITGGTVTVQPGGGVATPAPLVVTTQGTANNIQSPFLALNFLIAVQGLYPDRN